MHSIRKVLIGGGLAAAAMAGGAIGATLVGAANAQTSTTTPPATTAPAPSSNATPSTPARPPMPAHGSQQHESQEKPVTGDAAAKAQAAAVQSLGGGTAGAVTTDFPGTGYEVTVTKADGTQVEVHLDSSFAVMQGGPGHHGQGRPNDNDADDQPGATSTNG